PEGACNGRLVGDDVQSHRARRLDRFRWREDRRVERVAADCEHGDERLLERRDGRPPDLDAGVAPGFETPPRVAQPALADAKAADEADVTVDDDRLPMVARQPTERARQPRRVE